MLFLIIGSANPCNIENVEARKMSSFPITRGFMKKAPPRLEELRVPPGQHATSDFPVLSAGPSPHILTADWTLTLQLGSATLSKWRWEEFRSLPQTTVKADIHCVTRWSKLDTVWSGVLIDDLFKAADIKYSPLPFVMAHCEGGYTTNIRVDDLLGGRALVATHFDGAPLTQTHGGPARLVIPHLYFWKSAKWLRRLRFMEHDAPGFWEALGYHNEGDPWKEQRYAVD